MPNPNVGAELLNAPFSEMVLKLALAIAEGQTKLDMNSTEVAKFMSETTIQLPSISTPAVPAVLEVKAVAASAPGVTPVVEEVKAVAPKDAVPAVLGSIEFPLIALGFFPGFYQFTEAIIEVKMAITMSKSSDFSLGVKAKAGIGVYS